MKGLILSGGKGTRLRPLTHTSAKQLIPVANKPVLFYGIEALTAAGITDLGIVVGETRKEVEEAVGDGSRWGAKVTYIPQEAPLGLAHAVLISKPFLQSDPFIMYLGDNLIVDGVKKFVKDYQKNKSNALILLVKVPNPKQFGVAELKDGRVINLVEKPRNPKSDLALVGVYMFDENIMKAVESIKPSSRGELEITDAIQWLIDNGHEVRSHIITGWWKDTGKIEDLLEANQVIMDNLEMRVHGFVDEKSEISFKVVIEEGAEIINSRIRGPAVIGKNSVIVNSFIGPFTCIAEDCTIKNAEIEHSIVLENSSILDIRGRIESSLIGKNVEISKTLTKPKAYTFMVGDSSKIGIF